MNVNITLEHRFARATDGTFWTQTTFPYPFWARYLEVFDHVNVIARVQDTSAPLTDWKRADGEGVSFIALPNYSGPKQYLFHLPRMKRIIKNSVDFNEVFILRVASQISQLIEPKLVSINHPYAVEVVADPYDVFAPGAVRHPLRPFFRWRFTHKLKQQCSRACAAAYVTQYALQKRYPPSEAAYTTYYSDIELLETALVSQPRHYQHAPPIPTLITVGTLSQLYKAQDVLIDAVSICIKKGLNLKLVIIGDGRYRSELESRCIKLGLSKNIIFKGQLPAGSRIFKELDQADLFVLPSRQEGLPRALLEAMARGLPCIGSTVGGIPELLTPDTLVVPNNALALAKKIQEVVIQPERLNQMSTDNLEKAKEYQDEVLDDRRNYFYRQIDNITQEWLKKKVQKKY
jgi:glycosyltransferase involved in cell wall biosynthesis